MSIALVTAVVYRDPAESFTEVNSISPLSTILPVLMQYILLNSISLQLGSKTVRKKMEIFCFSFLL